MQILKAWDSNVIIFHYLFTRFNYFCHVFSLDMAAGYKIKGGNKWYGGTSPPPPSRPLGLNTGCSQIKGWNVNDNYFTITCSFFENHRREFKLQNAVNCSMYKIVIKLKVHGQTQAKNLLFNEILNIWNIWSCKCNILSKYLIINL